MDRKRRLVFMILKNLDLLENDENQPLINQIRGLLFELLDNL